MRFSRDVWAWGQFITNPLARGGQRTPWSDSGETDLSSYGEDRRVTVLVVLAIRVAVLVARNLRVRVLVRLSLSRNHTR